MVTVEPMGPDQWRRVRDVRLRALRDAPAAFWTTVEQEETTTPAEWRERLARADAATFVATRDDVDVGLVVGAPHHHVPGEAGLYAMWVAPQARRSGAGGQLVRAVIGWARDAGYRRLRLDVADDNAAAVAFYERMGFQPTGLREAMPAPRDHITEHERALNLDDRSG